MVLSVPSDVYQEADSSDSMRDTDDRSWPRTRPDEELVVVVAVLVTVVAFVELLVALDDEVVVAGVVVVVAGVAVVVVGVAVVVVGVAVVVVGVAVVDVGELDLPRPEEPGPPMLPPCMSWNENAEALVT